MVSHRLRRLALLTQGAALVGLGLSQLACGQDPPPPAASPANEPTHINAPGESPKPPKHINAPDPSGADGGTPAPRAAPLGATSPSASPAASVAAAPTAPSPPSPVHMNSPARQTPPKTP